MKWNNTSEILPPESDRKLLCLIDGGSPVVLIFSSYSMKDKVPIWRTTDYTNIHAVYSDDSEVTHWLEIIYPED